MAGLLDFIGTPEGQGLLSAAFGGLAGARRGAPLNSIGIAGLSGLQGYQGAQYQDTVNKYREAQSQKLQNDLARQQRLDNFTANLGNGPVNVQAAFAAGMDPSQIKALVESPNWGKAQIKDYRDVRAPDGSVQIMGFDEFGNQVSTGQAPFKAPEFRDLGGKQVAIDPVTLKPVWEGAKSMSPGEVASNRISQAHLGLAQQRLALEREQMGGPANNPMYKGAPAGYRWNMQGGLEPIPGGPATANAKPPTEFQGKSAAYGARAEAADKTITDLQGKYFVGGLAAKHAVSGIPVTGGVFGGIGNALLSENQQKVDQAERDFVNAVLRQESGAAISPAEFDNARKQYFAQPWDSQAVIEQKARNRQAAIEGFKRNAGPAAFSTIPAPAAGSWGIKKVD